MTIKRVRALVRGVKMAEVLRQLARAWLAALAGEGEDYRVGEITRHARALGWPAVAIPRLADDDEVPGMILGTEEYVEAMTTRETDWGMIKRAQA